MNDATRPVISLRELVDADLDVLFVHQLDEEANQMAAFTKEDPSDREAYDAHWAKVRAHAGVTMRAVEVDGALAGSILAHDWFGEPEVAFWYGREFWGRGIATRALQAFLQVVTDRPLLARVAFDNVGSKRVLEKVGFRVQGTERGFANARGCEIEEFVMALDGPGA